MVLEATDADPALDGICKDVGRSAVAGWIVGLHFSGGLTLPRLKALCARSGIVSPGRGRAILAYMRFLRYVVTVRGEVGRSPALYEPTPACLRAWRTFQCIALEAASLMEPEAALARAQMDEPRFAEAFICKFGLGIVEFVRERDLHMPAWDVLLHRRAGVQILHALSLSADDDGIYPPEGALHVPISELARRFKVSRPHVARLFRDGEKSGLFVRHDGAAIGFTAEGRQAYLGLLRLRFSAAIWFAAWTTAEMAQQVS